MESLEVLNFHPSKVMAHPRVLAWHDDLDHEVDMDPDFDEMDADDAVDAFWN
ncbi:hypothetical protein SERLA73DRAFT_176100 [Serpula lacrymans var. lacrymans S7.3]|uniref:Uncharacterized protein n=2 Tax=Serpula lacrymans var. lacrymans TaxID=341189 RepID=F8PMB5_SERL3|nr:uncharacterized protein SERLADRAFT_458858 [Serpula lacrymans var. lacrymans S7.9]EGO02747.1 hypothetical protein SERLA73DRAFT_176100 [Serpula lacrymans var. lacrymans S7.3]EGO28448.1 hypothetical protein SERLADRAFT_458858 [Serpula lacrymans var. lacrymans S7.9]